MISIAKNAISQDTLLALLETLHLEQSAKRIDFDDSLLDLGNEINAHWWQTNKERFKGFHNFCDEATI